MNHDSQYTPQPKHPVFPKEKREYLLWKREGVERSKTVESKQLISTKNQMGRITEFVRKLRKNATPEEDLLWQHLRNRKLSGKKFLRQHPIFYSTAPVQQFFVADFYCAEAKLIIELDGKYHDFQKDYDENRDTILSDLGLKVIRFKNEDLLNLPLLLNQIQQYL